MATNAVWNTGLILLRFRYFANMLIMNFQTPETNQTLARLQYIQHLRRELPAFDPNGTAMLVIDMQNRFARLWNRQTDTVNFNILSDFICKVRDTGLPVIRTQHGHTNPELDGGVLHKWWEGSIIENTLAHRFIKGFEPVHGDDVIQKKRYDAFIDTPLETILKEKNIHTLIVSGVMTNLCCETTARSAFCRDYNVIFLIDGTATVDEIMHRSSLLNLGFGFAYLATCKETAAWLHQDKIDEKD